MNAQDNITRIDPVTANGGWPTVMDAINVLKQAAQEKPAADGMPSITVATLRELHGAADEIGGLFGKMDNIVHALSALTNRFDDGSDECAADYLLGELKGVVNAADDKISQILGALRPYGEG